MQKYRRAVNVFTSVVLVFGFLMVTYTIGYIIGKDRGYHQRRQVEVEIGQMLYERGLKKKPLKRF